MVSRINILFKHSTSSSWRHLLLRNLVTQKALQAFPCVRDFFTPRRLHSGFFRICKRRSCCLYVACLSKKLRFGKVFVLCANFFVVEANEERRHAINSTSITLRNEFSKRNSLFHKRSKCVNQKTFFLSSERFVAAGGGQLGYHVQTITTFSRKPRQPKDLLHRRLANLFKFQMKIRWSIILAFSEGRHQKNELSECWKVHPPAPRGKLIVFRMGARQSWTGFSFRQTTLVRWHLNRPFCLPLITNHNLVKL